MRKFWLALLASLILLSLAGCQSTTESDATPPPLDDFTPMVSVTGKAVPAEWTTVAPQAGGMIIEVLVDDGDTVAEGDLLVRLDDTDARMAVLQAEAALAVAEAQLARNQVGARPEEIAVAEAQLEAARAQLAQAVGQRNQVSSDATEAEIAAAEAAVAAAQAEQLAARQQHDETLKCYDVTLPDGSTEERCPLLGTMEEQARYTLNAANQALEASQAQLQATEAGASAQNQAAEAGVWAASAQRDVAEAQLKLLKAGVLPQDVAVAQASVTQAEAAVSAAQVALERAEVRAPLAGTVGLVHVREGEFVAPGQPLVILGDLDTLRVETTDLDEIDVGQVVEGQSATVTFEALPDLTFEGTITHIAPMADPQGSGVTYTVIVELSELDPAIRWGMTAFVDIEL